MSICFPERILDHSWHSLRLFALSYLRMTNSTAPSGTVSPPPPLSPPLLSQITNPSVWTLLSLPKGFSPHLYWSSLIGVPKSRLAPKDYLFVIFSLKQLEVSLLRSTLSKFIEHLVASIRNTQTRTPLLIYLNLCPDAWALIPTPSHHPCLRFTGKSSPGSSRKPDSLSLPQWHGQPALFIM